jgi:hypothetical protein
MFNGLKWSLVALVLVGCGGPLGLSGGSGGGSGPVAFAPGNNSAILSGPAVGSGGINFALQKRLTVTVREPSSELSALDAFLFRQNDRDGLNTIAVRVKNVGSQPLCMVGATDLHLMAGATRLKTVASATLTGAMGFVTNLRVHTCLAAGEVGVIAYDFIDYEPTDFEDATELKLSWDNSFKDHAVNLTAPTGRVVPTGYTLERNNQVVFSFTNQGTTGVRVERDLSAMIFGINSRGELTDLFIAAQDLYPASGQLAVGAQGTVTATINSTHTSEKLWVFMLFDDYGL